MTFARAKGRFDGLRTNESVPGTFGTLFGQTLFRSFNPNPLIILSLQAGTVGVDTFEVGTTVGVRAQFYDETGALFTPTGGNATIYVRNPLGVVVFNYVNMNAESLGTFNYQIPIADAGPLGTWLVRVKGELSSGNSISDAQSFRVVVTE